MTDNDNSRNSEKSMDTVDKINGVAASPGIAIGPAYIYNNENFWIEERDLPPEAVDSEIERFNNAINSVIKNMTKIRADLELKIGEEHASIFDPHIMLLQDPSMLEETVDLIRQGKNAEFAFFRTSRKLIKAYKRLDDEYMRERITDIKDIVRRVATILQGKSSLNLASLDKPSIVVAPNLNPTDTALMHASMVMALITDMGGMTSHASILARALQIPAVIGTKNASSFINQGDTVIVDGTGGNVFVNPDESTIHTYRKTQRQLAEYRHSLEDLKDLPAVTIDGHTIGLHANIEFQDEVESVVANGAEGIGLYRSEFHFLVEDRTPTEEDLFTSYRAVVEKLAPKPVVIRTLDIGGDKISHLVPSPPEANPYLGWRAIRVSLAQKDLFRIQLRAILRASAHGNLAVMFPMVSCMEELDETLSFMDTIKTELIREGIPFDPDIRVGIMIELPAAVMVADHLARKVDFFSIGTNDLIQYSVAVDRANDRIASLFEPFHPGIIRLTKMTVDAAHTAGIPVAVCGEMGGDPAAALLLLGLDIDELSMIPSFVPAVKSIVRSVNKSDARRIVKQVLECPSATDVKAVISRELGKLKCNLPYTTMHTEKGSE